MAEQEQVQRDRADREVIQQAAARLRHDAIAAGYAGLPRKELAFGLALVLDELGRHVRELHADVRRQAVESSRAIVTD